MNVSTRKITLTCLCACAVVLSVLLAARRIAVYECAVEFTYADTRVKPKGERADAANGRAMMTRAMDCFAQLASELNLRRISDRFTRESASEDGDPADVYSVLSGMQFAIIERPGTNSAMRCRILLKSRNRSMLLGLSRLCMDSYKDFVEGENTTMLDRAVYREHIEWVRCKRRIEELEREMSKGQEDASVLAAERSKLAVLANEEAEARERAKGHGMQMVVGESVNLSISRLAFRRRRSGSR